FKRKQLLPDRLQTMIAADEDAHLAMRRPVLLDDIMGIVPQLRPQLAPQRFRVDIGAAVYRRQTGSFGSDVILQVLGDLKRRNDQQAKQHGVDDAIIGGDENHDVVGLPLAMNRPAHMRVNKRNADKRDDKKDAAKDQGELGGGQAVQPREERSPHG